MSELGERKKKCWHTLLLLFNHVYSDPRSRHQFENQTVFHMTASQLFPKSIYLQCNQAQCRKEKKNSKKKTWVMCAGKHNSKYPTRIHMHCHLWINIIIWSAVYPNWSGRDDRPGRGNERPRDLSAEADKKKSGCRTTERDFAKRFDLWIGHILNNCDTLCGLLIQ